MAAGFQTVDERPTGHLPASNSHVNGNSQSAETLENDRILIAGGGPVGLVLAKVLSFYGVKSLVLERNSTTTRFELQSHR